jgi:hypothetical protein
MDALGMDLELALQLNNRNALKRRLGKTLKQVRSSNKQ